MMTRTLGLAADAEERVRRVEMSGMMMDFMSFWLELMPAALDRINRIF